MRPDEMSSVIFSTKSVYFIELYICSDCMCAREYLYFQWKLPSFKPKHLTNSVQLTSHHPTEEKNFSETKSSSSFAATAAAAETETWESPNKTDTVIHTAQHSSDTARSKLIMRCRDFLSIDLLGRGGQHFYSKTQEPPYLYDVMLSVLKI